MKMEYLKRFKKWYMFPMENPNLSPSIFWMIFFMLTLPIIICIMGALSLKGYLKERKIKRKEFKKKYLEQG